MSISRAESEEKRGSRWRPRLSSLIIFGFVAGVACGVFFGDWCAPLKPVGDVFIGLLRMSVLPFVTVSLIANVGRLSSRQSRQLAVAGTTVMLVLWCIGLLTVYILPHSFPTWKAGSFFSAVMVEPSPNLDFFDLFIPSNIFNSLSANYVPAVVVFCICVGLALGTLNNRQLLIGQLDVLSKALIQVSTYVAKFAPLGVFAITANISGTISLEEFSRLRAYMVTYTAGAALLTFGILPLLITSCTPFRYRDVIEVAKDALVTAFATGKLIVVLPMLIAKTEQLFAQQHVDNGKDATPEVDVLYPLVYPFPHVGNLLALLFIPFAAWFSGSAMRSGEFPAFLGAGLFSYFGGPLLATPFLLDQMRLPHDMFQLFLASGVYCERLSDSVGVMHLVAFTILTTCICNGTFQFRPMRLVKLALFSALTMLAMTVVLRFSLSRALESLQDREDVIANMQLLDHPVESIVITETAPNPDPLYPGESLLQRVRRRGAVRVGYNEDKLPFAYFNVRGDLVGFDINMAHALARDLGVAIEFVRFDRTTLAQQLQDDDFDVVMSGLIGTLERSAAMKHTRPYMDVTLSLVVPDYRVRSFASLESMRQIDGLRIGFVDLSRGFVSRLRRSLPNAELVELRTNREFFDGTEGELEALLISAESGSAFTLLYPQFEVVIPSGPRVSLPLFYAIGGADDEMREFLEHWVALRQKDGTLQENYDHWILGKTQTPKKRRWCVMRNVLGWGK